MALINGTAFDGPKNAANIATHSKNKTLYKILLRCLKKLPSPIYKITK